VSFFLKEPWAHQRDCFERAKGLPCFAFLFEMGAGKTSTVINVLRWKYLQALRVLKTLYLGPPIIVQNVSREFHTYSRVGGKVVCLEGSGKKRAAALRSLGDPNSIVVTNYESLLMPEVFEELVAWGPEAVVFDESHKLKNPSAKRTKRAIQLADAARFRYILTGTPILNSPMDLFSQFRALDGGELLGKNFFVFRARYFYDKNAGMPKAKYFPDWRIKPGALDELNARIKPVSMTVKKADCLDLPPLVRQEIAVELSHTQRRLYDSMRKDFVAYLGDKACVATLAITKALRLMQIAAGFVALEGEGGEDRTNVAIAENPRAQVLKELLADLAPDHKVLVWSHFRQGYAIIRGVCEELGLGYVEVHGDISAKAKQEAVDRLNDDPSVRVFIGHPASGGIGVNLVAASYSIFYSRGFSLEADLQAESRNYRGGSERHEKVTRIDLIAKDTIDEVISSKLAAKVDISEKILRDIAGAL
jgi:SNF2 family DNA or RNA helicase